ncbi:MAG: hypothetical protein ACUVQP_00035 [Bacteroidales bacterium]
MKRWLSISLGVALQIAQLFTNKIPDEGLRQSTQAVIVAVTGVLLKKTSETNPDGTPARVPWEKK